MGTEAAPPGKGPPPPERSPEQLLASVEKLIHKRVQEMAPQLADHERQDASQMARKEAWIAALRYRASYGTRFTTFAVPYITGGIAAYLRGEVKQTNIKRRMRSLGAEYLAEEPDDFNVIYDDDATLAARLQIVANRHAAAMVLGLSQVPADPEEALAESKDRKVAARIASRVIAQATPSQKIIVRMRYGEGRPMKEIAVATGTPERTLRLHHEKLLDALHEKMEAAGITEPPDAEEE